MPTARSSKSSVLAAIGLIVAVAVGVSAQAPGPAGQTITGVAIDATGAVLPIADVVLTTSNATIRTTTTDATGTFRFEGVPQGRYEIRVTFEGFQPTTARVTVGSRAPSPLRITLRSRT